MRHNTSSVLLTLSILIISTAYFFGNDKPEQIQNKSPRKLYSVKIDSFLTALQKNYGKAMKDSTWRHLNMFERELINVQFDDFEFITVAGDSVTLGAFKKALVVVVGASWCGPCKAAIPALEDLAATYSGKIQFLYIMHDGQPKSLEFFSKTNSNIPVIPSDRNIDPMQPVKAEAGKFRHVLQFPATYYLDANRVIKRVTTGGFIPSDYTRDGKTIKFTKEDVYDANIKSYTKGIKLILAN